MATHRTERCPNCAALLGRRSGARVPGTCSYCGALVEPDSDAHDALSDLGVRAERETRNEAQREARRLAELRRAPSTTTPSPAGVTGRGGALRWLVIGGGALVLIGLLVHVTMIAVIGVLLLGAAPLALVLRPSPRPGTATPPARPGNAALEHQMHRLEPRVDGATDRDSA